MHNDRWIGVRLSTELLSSFTRAANAAGLSRSEALRESIATFCEGVARDDSGARSETDDREPSRAGV